MAAINTLDEDNDRKVIEFYLPKKLKMCGGEAYGTKVKALFDPGVILDVISKKTCEILHLRPGKSRRMIKVADVLVKMVLG